METKICTKCSLELPASSEYFNKCNKVKSGLKAICKKCSYNENKIYDKKNYKKRLKQATNWKKRNREQLNKYMRKWYKNNEDKKRIYSQNSRNNLSDFYIKSIFTNSGRNTINSNIPKELIEEKRQQLLLHRAIKNLKTKLKEIEDNELCTTNK